jgi:sugar O-acyltransferase (sialic acid O-acetyltransferase NeuD family)
MSESLQAIVIIGAGGHAREVHQLILDINRVSPTWQVLGFAAERGLVTSARVHGLPVFCVDELADRYPTAQLVIAVGSPSLRRRLSEALESRRSCLFPTLVHPSAMIGNGVEIGQGCVIFAGCILTTDIFIGRHVHINTAATVSHDSRIGDFATLGPRSCCCGNVTVATGAEIGAAAVLIPRTSVGAHSVLGAGAVLTRPLSDSAVAVGLPARARS